MKRNHLIGLPSAATSLSRCVCQRNLDCCRFRNRCWHLNGFMTYEIGQAVDKMIGPSKVHFEELYRILALFGGVVIVTVVSQWLIQRLGIEWPICLSLICAKKVLLI